MNMYTTSIKNGIFFLFLCAGQMIFGQTTVPTLEHNMKVDDRFYVQYNSALRYAEDDRGGYFSASTSLQGIMSDYIDDWGGTGETHLLHSNFSLDFCGGLFGTFGGIFTSFNVLVPGTFVTSLPITSQTSWIENTKWSSYGGLSVRGDFGGFLLSKFGSVGAFWGAGAGDTEREGQLSDGFNQMREEENTALGYLKFAFSMWDFYSKLNTKNYPFIGRVLEEVFGFIGFKQLSVIKYAYNIVSRPIRLSDKITITHLAYYQKKGASFNWNTKSDIYGFQIGLKKFIFEGGYQNYSSFEFEPELGRGGATIPRYKDGMFGKITYLNEKFSLGAEMSTVYFPMPKLTASVGFASGNFIGHFWYSPDFCEFGIGYKWEWPNK